MYQSFQIESRGNRNDETQSESETPPNKSRKTLAALAFVAFVGVIFTMSKMKESRTADDHKKIQVAKSEDATWPIFSSEDQSGCPPTRVRRPWSDLTRSQKKVYVDGFRALRNTSNNTNKLKEFLQQHGDAPLAHGNPFFLPWHRYFIWEFETQIRRLGPRFRCFTLPYWDWTIAEDTGIASAAALPMFNEGLLGGNGDANDQWCVKGHYFSLADGYSVGGVCLKRNIEPEFNFLGPSSQAMTQFILPNKAFSAFWEDLEDGEHDMAHGVVGGWDGQIGDVATATDDPVFWMLHGMVDMLWALRQDCYPNRTSEPDFPSTEDENRNSGLDFAVLKTRPWSVASTMGPITSAMVFDSQNSFLKVNYDIKEFMKRVKNASLTLDACEWGDKMIKEDGLFGKRRGRRWHGKSWQQSLDDDCIASYRHCMKLRTMCRYKEPLETCAASSDESEITLKDVLGKRGVRGNRCIRKARKRAFKMAKRLGCLEAMCEGKMDNVCRLC